MQTAGRQTVCNFSSPCKASGCLCHFLCIAGGLALYIDELHSNVLCFTCLTMNCNSIGYNSFYIKFNGLPNVLAIQNTWPPCISGDPWCIKQIQWAALSKIQQRLHQTNHKMCPGHHSSSQGNGVQYGFTGNPQMTWDWAHFAASIINKTSIANKSGCIHIVPISCASSYLKAGACRQCTLAPQGSVMVQESRQCL